MPIDRKRLAELRAAGPPIADTVSAPDLITSYRAESLAPVTLEAAMSAAAWCELLEAHAKRIYQAASDGDPDDAIRLAERIKESLPNPFTYRIVAKKGGAGLTTSEEVRKAVDILEDRGWVRVLAACMMTPEGTGRDAWRAL